MLTEGMREAEILEVHPILEAADLAEALHYAAACFKI
jgi:uncharacterized protein (DUF433 family)